MTSPHSSGPALGRARALAAGALALAAVALGGCFDAPSLEDRWTRIDLVASNVSAGQAVAPGSAPGVQLSADITYRAIVTGYAVAELRASSLSPAQVALTPSTPRLQEAQDVDRILATSVSLGRAVRPVTGWDHLIQRVDFAFTGAVPAAMDSLATGGAGGLYLVCYLGSGVKLELPSGQDSIVVTPFDSQQHELLPIALPLAVAGPRSRP